MSINQGLENYSSDSMTFNDFTVRGKLMKKIEKVEWYHKADWHEKFFEVKFPQHELVIRKSDKLKDQDSGQTLNLSELLACSEISLGA